MRLSKLVDPQFQITLKKLASQDVPLRTAFKLRGIVRTTNEQLTSYEEVRIEAINRLGERNEDGTLNADANGSVKLSDENMKSFVDQLNALLATSVAVPTIKLEELGDKASLTTQELIVLDELIVD
jgi:hypothetical protein